MRLDETDIEKLYDGKIGLRNEINRIVFHVSNNTQNSYDKVLLRHQNYFNRIIVYADKRIE